jgi:glutaredoxin-related protein
MGKSISSEGESQPKAGVKSFGIKKIVLVVLIIIAGVLVFGYFRNSGDSGSSQTATVSASDPVILFYGKECPHCQAVEDFINKNNVKDKVKFVQAEVFHNKGNQGVFIEKEKACGVTDESQMGVPLLVENSKCYSGQEDVMKYFQDKINNAQ